MSSGWRPWLGDPALRADSRRRPETPRRGEGAGAGQRGSRAEAPEPSEFACLSVPLGGVCPWGRVCPVFTGEWRAGPCARVSVWGTPRAASARAGTGPGMRRRLRERRRRPSTRDLPSAIPFLETPPGRGKAWTRRGCARGSSLGALAAWGRSPVCAGLWEGRGKPSRTGSSGIHSRAVLRSDRCRPGPEPRSESPVLLRSAPAVSRAPGNVSGHVP